MYTAVQSQKAVSAYFTSKQILPFGFAERYYVRENPVIYIITPTKLDQVAGIVMPRLPQ